MAILKVHDKEFEPYLSSKEIDEQVNRLAAEINRDYRHKKPLFITILNGAFMFAADLFKHIEVEAEICFIKLASYRGVKSTGKVITAIGLDIDIFDRDVIVIEDIVRVPFRFERPKACDLVRTKGGLDTRLSLVANVVEIDFARGP